MKVAVRVDAASQIGSGHVMRCLTLADELRAQGHDVGFLMHRPPSEIADIVSASGHSIHEVRYGRNHVALDTNPPSHQHWLATSQAGDASACTALFHDAPSDWLVVDHYALDHRWEHAMRSSARRILVIDDLADRPHDCDLLLDQNYYADDLKRYQSLVPAHCRQLLGPRTALLRDEFCEARLKCRPRRGDVHRILVFMTTFDPANVTSMALDAVERLDRSDIAFDIVTGQGNPYRTSLAERVGRLANCTFHCPAIDMADLVLRADLAVGAGGSATLERCFLGLPTLAMDIADNQRRMLRDLDAAGGVVHIGPADQLDSETLKVMLESMIADEKARTKISERGLCLVADGKARVVEAMEQLLND